MVTELPPFRDLKSCLDTVFGRSRSAVKLSLIYKRKPGTKPLKPRPRPTSWEEASAEKGMIKRWLYDLQFPYNAVLISIYARGPERGKAQGGVVKFVMPRLPMTIRRRRLVYQLVAQCFGKSVRYEQLADEFDIEARLVERYAAAVSECVAAVTLKAEAIATDELKERGVID